MKKFVSVVLMLVVAVMFTGIVSAEDDAKYYFDRGNEYVAKGKPDKAIQYYTRAIGLKPDYSEAYNNRGKVYLAERNPPKAIEDFSKAIEFKPDFAEAYYNRGKAHILRWGNYKEAIEDFTEAIDLKPDYSEVYSNRGLAYVAEGEYSEGINDLNKAIEIKPNDAELYVNRGKAYLSRKEYDKALEDSNKAIEINPDYIQKHAEADHTTSNRKTGICPACGREELISKDSELVKCSVCVQMGTSQKQEHSLKGEDIKTLREKMGVSITSLADDLKISKGVLSEIENGRRRINSKLISWYDSNKDLNSQIALF